MKINVCIGLDEIEKGVRGNNEYCPIALNLKAQGYDDVEVLSETCAVNKDGLWKKFNLPPEAKKFIKLFDDGRVVEPISFELDAS